MVWPTMDADDGCRDKKKKKNDASHWDPKCYHSITGDSDGFRLLMACEVLAAADQRVAQ